MDKKSSLIKLAAELEKYGFKESTTKRKNQINIKKSYQPKNTVFEGLPRQFLGKDLILQYVVCETIQRGKIKWQICHNSSLQWQRQSSFQPSYLGYS
jgi:hypothetical protein